MRYNNSLLQITLNQFEGNEISKKAYIEQMYNLHCNMFLYKEYIKHTNIKKIEIIDDEVIMTTRENDIKLVCDTKDMRNIAIEVLNFKDYEKELLNLMKQMIGPTYNIFDIGANIGWYSLNLGKLFPKASIYCFEPIPQTYKELLNNIRLNKIENIVTFNLGLADENKVSDVYYPGGSSGNASLRDLTGYGDKFSCQIRRLDDIVDEEKLNVDFIKCDVEGAELLVIKGAIQTIKVNKPIIFIEMLRKWSYKFNYHPNEIIEILTDLGYKCFTIHNNKLKRFYVMDDETRETNFIFLHKEKHYDKIKRLS